MRYATRIAVGLMCIGVLVGCGSEPTGDTATTTVNNNAGSTSTLYVVTVDGRKIPCVVWWWGQAGGISCDWSTNANIPQ